MSFCLQYKSHALIEDLVLGECTIHRAASASGRWWILWFYVARETDGRPEDFAIPVNPNGSYVENGPGGRTWGLNRSEAGVWSISPSINVENTDARTVHAGDHPVPSLWHQTPDIVYVPENEPWIHSAP